MKVALVEMDFIFLTQPVCGGHGNRVTVHAGRHRRKLYLSFSIGGPADARESLPADLVIAIQKGLAYARKHVRASDLEEIDLETDEGSEDET